MHPGQDRVTHLDGLRGVAILSVVLWHYTYAGYERFLPYGSAYSAIPLLDHGWVGVNLFFLISGYVILLTLERCSTFAEFMTRRWLRLFPAMLVASLAIFAVSRVMGDLMPHGRPDPINLLPGLTFVIPTLWQAILQRSVDELDGVFWTLYVEMGFYVAFGLLHFAVGWRRGLVALATIWLVAIAGWRLADRAPMLASWTEPLQWFGAAYFGWFVSGALFRKASETGSLRLFAGAMLAGLASAFTSGLWQPDDILSCLYLCGCVALFAAVLRSATLQRVLATRFLLFVGAISYPLYLLHNEIGIGLIGASGAVLPEALWPALPVLVLALMMMLAWLVGRWIEPAIAGSLRRRLTLR